MVRRREERGAEQRRALTGPAFYVLWQGRRRCYVGQTSRLEMRLAGHRAALLLAARLEVRCSRTGRRRPSASGWSWSWPGHSGVEDSK
jgi:hypothetical protein